jgi:hypothetical protein
MVRELDLADANPGYTGETAAPADGTATRNQDKQQSAIDSPQFFCVRLRRRGEMKLPWQSA